MRCPRHRTRVRRDGPPSQSDRTILRRKASSPQHLGVAHERRTDIDVLHEADVLVSNGTESKVVAMNGIGGVKP